MYETRDFKTLTLTMEIHINAPVERVWAALTNDLPAWWPQDFIIGGEGASMHFDAQPGGLMYESWPSGGGMVWGRVLVLKPNELLQTAGDLFAEYGGPAHGHITYRLEATADGTVVHFTDVTFGAVSDEMGEQKQQGWDYLFGTMKTWCEKV